MGIISKFKQNKFKKSFLKAVSLFQQGKYDDARDIFLYLLENDYATIDCNDYLFEIYHNLGDFKKALFYLNNSLELNPSNNDNLINKGILLYKLNRYDDSLECFDNALLIDNNHDYARVGKLSVLVEQGKYRQAKDFYNSIIINTNDDYILDKYATLLFEMNILDDALMYSDESLKLDENNAEYLNTKGLILKHLEEYDIALKYFDKALILSPNNLDYVLNRCSVYNSLSLYDDAIDCFNEVLKIDSNNVVAWTNLSNTYRLLKDYENCIFCIDKALDLDSENSVILDKKGLYLEEMGLYGEALFYFNKALNFNPQSSIILINKSRTLFRLKKYDDALNTVNKAYVLDNNRDVVLLKSKILAELGRIEEAEILEKEAENMSEMKDKPLIYN